MDNKRKEAVMEIAASAPAEMKPLIEMVLDHHDLLVDVDGKSSGTGSVDLSQHLEEQHSHPIGLCDSEKCAPCRNSRALHAKGVYEHAHRATLESLDAAAEYAGCQQARATLFDAYQKWLAASRPEPAEEAEPAEGPAQVEADTFALRSG